MSEVQEYFQEVRCPVCKRLLFKQHGHGVEIEIQCPKCKALVILRSVIQPEIRVTEKPFIKKI